MKPLLIVFILNCTLAIVLSLPLLGPYDETIQPFNLSPGNVNLETYWKQKYSEEARRDRSAGSRTTEDNNKESPENLKSNEQGSEKKAFHQRRQRQNYSYGNIHQSYPMQGNENRPLEQGHHHHHIPHNPPPPHHHHHY